MSKFNVGDKIKYIGPKHDINPQWFPIVGTIGTIVQDVDEVDCYIQWPKGSTSKEDCWYCNKNDIELVENENMTNEEIWEMLRPKIEKHNILVEPGVLYQGEDKLNQLLNPNIIEGKYVTDVYDATVARYAIALAYKVGYLRAMKGRPFKFGEKTEEKKKGGHWKPVNPENLPKEGTMVKLKKEYCNHYGGVVESGEIGIVFHDASYVTQVLGYGINFGKYKTVFLPLDRNIIANCLDMWVEDDE